jgi:hypothetical protein
VRTLAPCSCQSLPLAKAGGLALGPHFRGCNPISLLGPRALCSSFPRKREPRDFSRLRPYLSQGQALGPRFRGDDGLFVRRISDSLLRGDDERSGVTYANFRNEVLG